MFSPLPIPDGFNPHILPGCVRLSLAQGRTLVVAVEGLVSSLRADAGGGGLQVVQALLVD